jgi:hypothetical protein
MPLKSPQMVPVTDMVPVSVEPDYAMVTVSPPE